MWQSIKHNITIIIEGKWYDTCILNECGNISNRQKLQFKNNLWWNESGSYIYYSPTHFIDK